MNSCYLAIATIADLPPATGQTWSPQEKLEFQQQLAPLLDSPNPNHVLISCLGCIGDKRLSPRLIELLAHNDQLKRRSAAIALGNIGDPKALPALQHIAETDPYQQSDDRYPVRWSANEAIKKIRQKKVGHSASPSLAAELPPLEFKSSVDAVSERISEVFQKLDEFWEEMKQRSREYLLPMSDEELAKVYVKVHSRPFDTALQKVKENRQLVITNLVRHGYAWSKQDDKFHDRRYEQLVDGLAALGPKALPELVPYMRRSYISGGKPTLTVRALSKMGPDVVEPLLELLDTQQEIPKQNVLHVLMRFADARSKDVFLRNLDDKNGLVRSCSLRGLVKLGPDNVGREKLNSLLIDRLQDRACRGAAISGLILYGDESAIEPLRVVERSLRDKGEERVSSSVSKVINNIFLRICSQDNGASVAPAAGVLKAVASCSADAVRAGEPVVIELSLQNVSEEEITYVDFKTNFFLDEIELTTLLVDGRLVCMHTLLDVNDDGYKVIAEHKPNNVATEGFVSYTPLPIPREAFVVLKPGEKVAYLKVDLQPVQFRHETSKQALGPLQIPGEHTIQVEYHNRADGRQFGLNAWTGKVRSNVVTVRVAGDRSLDEINLEIKNLLSKLEKLEHEHLKIRKEKLDAMSDAEKSSLTDFKPEIKASGVFEEHTPKKSTPEARQNRDYEAARTVPQPIELWKAKKYGCGGNPRTSQKLQKDVKRRYPVLLTWPLIQDASKYVVQLNGVRGSRPVRRFESTTNSLRLEKADLVPGRYQWSVSVYDRHGKHMGDIQTIDPVEIFAIEDPQPVAANGKRVMIDLNHSAGHMRGWGYYNHAQYITKELLENAGFEVQV
ncbi:MAG: HEAT repeat domain-containing protein, partial [Planctomycetota bacterium]